VKTTPAAKAEKKENAQEESPKKKVTSAPKTKLLDAETI
jgi:hypothetical protein